MKQRKDKFQKMAERLCCEKQSGYFYNTDESRQFALLVLKLLRRVDRAARKDERNKIPRQIPGRDDYIQKLGGIR